MHGQRVRLALASVWVSRAQFLYNVPPKGARREGCYIRRCFDICFESHFQLDTLKRSVFFQLVLLEIDHIEDLWALKYFEIFQNQTFEDLEPGITAEPAILRTLDP